MIGNMALSPEEIQELLVYVVNKEQENAAILEETKKVLDMMNEKLAKQDETVNKLSSVVMDEIIGGIEELYNKNQHDMGIEEITSKYGDLFNPHLKVLKEFYPDIDLYEELYKEKSKFENDTDGAMFDARIREIADELVSKMNKAGIKKEEPVVETTVEVSEEEVPAVEEEPKEDIIESIKRMKSKKNPLGLA